MNKEIQPMIVVVSLLSGDGPTGVETHFNLIMDYAQKNGIEVSLVTPYEGHWLLRKVMNGLRRMIQLFSLEFAVLWNRIISYHIIRRRLRLLIPKNVDRNITVYAQDPLSAAAALGARKNIYFRVVVVSHFNVSEASEMVESGLTTEGSILWRAIMRIERQSLPRVNELIFVSKYMSQIVNKRLPWLSSVPQSIIHNFSSIPAKDSLIDVIQPRDLISIGTLEPRKNQQFLLHVLSACIQQGYHYTLTLAGNGPDRENLEHLAVKLGITQQVLFLGFVPNAARYIRAHRILTHAAHIENMPLTLIEALAYGRPIIAAPAGGIPEIFSDGIEGRYWNLDDVDNAAEILISVLNDENVWNRMASCAQDRFHQNFEPDVLGNRWMSVIIG
jgi:glycosyltransferase involved in cell wall biosynthesis